jgi:anti-sigma factor RsiW
MNAPVTDEELVAFLHGELEPGRAAEVEAAINDDPDVAGRAEALDRQDQLVRQALAP